MSNPYIEHGWGHTDGVRSCLLPPCRAIASTSATKVWMLDTTWDVHVWPITSVRLKVEQNQLVICARQVGYGAIGLEGA